MLKSFLNFDNFITPRIITIIYWLQIAGVAIFSLTIMFSGIGADIYYSGYGSFYRPRACLQLDNPLPRRAKPAAGEGWGSP